MSFSMEHLRSLGRDLAMVSQASLGTASSSKEFLDLVKAIGESKSKAEEDRIIAAEIEHLKSVLTQPDVSRKKMKEYIVRLMYVDILGHDASFGYINAVKMTHDDNLLYKRTGYLACTLFLDDNHDLIILIVNTLQKDLKSDNHLVVCAALGAVCKLINEETIPAVLQQVVDLVSHPKEIVRKKAVMTLHRFHQRSPSAVSHVLGKFKEALCDKDPSVMGASLCALHDLIHMDPAAYRSLVPSFLSILKQVVEGRLPSTFNYHKTPAPFIQIKILKLLALLGAGDAKASELIYPALADMMRRGDSKTNIGNAILYECICTGASIVPSSPLLVQCAEITSKLLKSDSNNLKYMGIDALSRIVKINPEFANEHQLAVIDCLEDPDDTLKRKTLDLLYKMTRPANVEVIVEKMLQYLRDEQQKLKSALHSHGKVELASRVIELAERFAPSNHWYIETMNTVFELAGDVVRPQTAHDLIRLIAEGGSGGDGEDEEDSDSHLRSSAVESYVKLMEEPNLPPLMLQVICWVLGEYATTDGHMDADDVIAKLCDITSSHSADDDVRAYVLTAIAKIASFEVARRGTFRLSPEAQSFVDDMAVSHSTDLQQRAYELKSLIALPRATVAAVMPEDASCEDIEIDSSMKFLDAYVSKALAQGAAPYRDPSDRSLSTGVASLALSLPATSAAPAPHDRGLRFEAYEQPKVPTAPVLAAASASAVSSAAPSSWGEPPRGRGPEADYGRGLAFDAGAGNIRVAEPGERRGGGDARLRLEGVQRKWGMPAPGPAAPAPSGSPYMTDAEREDAELAAAIAASMNGMDHDRPGPPPATSAPPPPPSGGGYRARKEEPEVSEEKVRLAASLFGGAKPGGSSGTPSKTKGPPKKWGRSEAGSSSSAPTAPAAPPAAPAVVQDLLDFSDAPSSAAPAAAASPAVDPFSQLADLDVPVAPVASGGPANGAQAGAPKAAAPLGSLLDSVGSVTATGSPNSSGTKGPTAVQRDATARQVGVASANMGANPELFKDILS